MFYFYKDHCTGNGFPDYTAPYFTFPCVIKNEIFMAVPLSENTPPKKLPPLLGSFWMKTPWRVTVWVWHGCPSTYPTFFGGPISETAFRTQKGNGKQKKTLNNPSNPHWVCLLQLPPPKKNHPLRTEKTGWASPRYFPPAGPEIRWDRCVPGNDVAPPVASKEPRRWRPTGLVLEQSNSIQKMTVFFWGQKLKM